MPRGSGPCANLSENTLKLDKMLRYKKFTHICPSEILIGFVKNMVLNDESCEYAQRNIGNIVIEAFVTMVGNGKLFSGV